MSYRLTVLSLNLLQGADAAYDGSAFDLCAQMLRHFPSFLPSTDMHTLHCYWEQRGAGSPAAVPTGLTDLLSVQHENMNGFNTRECAKHR